MFKIIDRSKKEIRSGIETPLNLENVVLKISPPISLDLIDWEKAGLRIGVSMEGIGKSHFNEQPYSNIETALREYEHVLTQVQKGNYSLELYGNRKLKLILTDSE